MASRRRTRIGALLLLTIVVGGGIALPAIDAALFHGPRTSTAPVRFEAEGASLVHPAQCAVSEQRQSTGHILIGRGIVLRSHASTQVPAVWTRPVAPPSPPSSTQLSRAPPVSIA